MRRRNFGLLLTYNEVDVIEESLARNAPMVDAIFALDGSDDGTAAVLAAHPKVELLLRDDDVVDRAAGERVRDWHRQRLLDAVAERYGSGHWITLLHGDEILHDDARAVATAAEAQGAARVNWAAMQFFLHPDDAPFDPALPVQERVRWYSPLWVEVRQFRTGPRTRYRRVHGRVVPDGVGIFPYRRMPIVKHYPYRTPEQARRRLAAMRARGFSGSDLAAPGGAGGADEGDATGVLRRRFEPAYRVARRFDGDFGELELARQGPLGLLRMLWRWKRWVRPP